MGRYYSTDAGYEGKFWVGLQSSTDPGDVYGMEERDTLEDEQQIIYYSDDIKMVRKRLDGQFEKLGVPMMLRKYEFSNAAEIWDYVWGELGGFFTTETPPHEHAIGWYGGEGKPTVYGKSEELERTASRIDLGLIIYNSMLKQHGECWLKAEY